MYWLIPALAAPFLYAVSGVVDNYLSDTLFRKTTSLVFYSFAFQLFILPIVFIIQRPILPPLPLLPFFLIAGLCEVLYLFPYYKALQSEDTAVVNSFWAMARVFVPIGAYFFIGETLGPVQYLGFLIVIGSSMLLANGRKGIRFNKSLLYMTVACLLISVEVIMYKHILTNTSWSTSYIGVTLLGIMLMFTMLSVPRWRKDVVSQWPTFKRHFRWLAIEGATTGAAAMSWSYAASLVSVSLVIGVGAIQPFAVLALAFIFSNAFPKFFKEKIDAKSMAKKLILFATTTIGVYLIAG